MLDPESDSSGLRPRRPLLRVHRIRYLRRRDELPWQWLEPLYSGHWWPGGFPAGWPVSGKRRHPLAKTVPPTLEHRIQFCPVLQPGEPRLRPHSRAAPASRRMRCEGQKRMGVVRNSRPWHPSPPAFGRFRGKGPVYRLRRERQRSWPPQIGLIWQVFWATGCSIQWRDLALGGTSFPATRSRW